MITYDLAIIGCGPVGLFATQFAKLHGLKTISFETSAELGGQVRTLYPNKDIRDIPAYSKINGNQLITNLSTKSKIINNCKVTTISKDKEIFTINNEYSCKAIIIATGIGAFSPKKLPFNLNNPFFNLHIHYSLTSSTSFKEKKIAIFGGGDTALDWAEQLSSPNNIVTIVHRRNEFRGLDSTANRLKKLNNVKFLTPYLPKTISLEDNKLAFNLKKLNEPSMLSMQFDEAFVAYGFNSNNNVIKKWNIEFEGKYIKVNRRMETNIPGVFAIGDVVTYDGRVPMIALGFGEAQIAVSNIMNKLFPEKKITLHSTSI